MDPDLSGHGPHIQIQAVPGDIGPVRGTDLLDAMPIDPGLDLSQDLSLGQAVPFMARLSARTLFCGLPSVVGVRCLPRLIAGRWEGRVGAVVIQDPPHPLVILAQEAVLFTECNPFSP